jgi:hypothetical protein
LAKKFIKTPSLLLFSLLYPAVIIIGLGLLLKKPPNLIFGGKCFVDFYFPEIIILSLSIYGLIIFPADIAFSRFSTNDSCYPFSAIRWLIYCLFHLIVSLTGMGLFFLSARFLFGTNMPHNFWMFFITLVFVQSGFFSLGIFLHALSSRASDTLVWSFSIFILYAIFSFCTLSFSKIGIFSIILQPFALNFLEWLPMTYAIRIMRTFFEPRNGNIGYDLMKFTVYMAVFVMLSVFLHFANKKKNRAI